MTMDRSARVERTLPVLFDQLAEARTPDYLEAAIERASSRPQRPAWTFPERWLPVELVTTRVQTTRLPMRQVGVLALLMILLAMVVAIYVGSRPRLPAPYGRAANGLIAYDYGGDIYTMDPVTGRSTALITGPAFDARPIFSPDGTRFAFARMGDRNALLLVARTDGSELIQVTPEPLDEFGPYYDPWSFSPDGRQILAITVGDRSTMILIPSDGSGVARELDVGMWAEKATFRPPDGAEILFVGRRDDGATGLYAVDVMSSAVRTVVEPRAGGDIWSPEWSPDGGWILYTEVDTEDVRHTHVISADGKDEIPVRRHPAALLDDAGPWSNDGQRLIVTRVFPPDGSNRQAVVLPVDGVGPEIEIRCPSEETTDPDDICDRWVWAPDDSLILGVYFDPKGRAIERLSVDPLTGATVAVPWQVDNGQPAWQRLAP